jgi:hypothetical protein
MPEQTYNLTQTAARLSIAGYQTSRGALSAIIKRGNGPPSRKGKRRSGGNGIEIIICWQEALIWATDRKGRWGGLSVFCSDSNVQEVTPRMKLNDQLIMHLKDTYPARWKEFNKLHGQEPLDRLNEIADAVTELARELFFADEMNNEAEIIDLADLPQKPVQLQRLRMPASKRVLLYKAGAMV